MASLHILKGANQGQHIELDADKIVLGRNPDCHIVISGTAVSRAHAHIVRANGKYFIEDLRSRNKTFVNNREIATETQVQLKDNDRIKICDFLCTFHDQPALKPLPDALRPEEPEPEEPTGSTTVEATLSSVGSHLLLETQPAEKLKMLLDMSALLRKTLELDPLLNKIVDSLFQLFRQADRGFLILRDEATSKLIPRVIKTRRPTDEGAARFSRRIVNMCLENVQALLSDDASGDSRFEMSQSIADIHIRSVMCAPLWTADNQGFGVIQLDTQDRNKRFTQDDLALLMGVASQASIALENARLHEEMIVQAALKRDLEIAREVQRGFLPTQAPEIPGYEFFACYEAAQQVGGDYYDFIALPAGRCAVMLGDVAGKGIPAALLMAKISAEARTCMLTEPGPGQAITKLNTQLVQSGLSERFITLVAALLDPHTHTIQFVNAGHPAPFLYRKASRSVEEATPTERTGLPIGVLDGQEYTSYSVSLEPGDAVLIFSDGVTDAMDRNNRPLLTRGVEEALAGGSYTPRSLGERVLNVVKQHASGRNQHDDITLISFGRTE